MRATSFLLTGLLSFSTGLVQAQANDHLFPPDDAFIRDVNYYVRLGRKLGIGSVTDSPLVQVVVMPSSAPEYTLSVKQQAADYVLTYRKAQKSIWNTSPHGLPAHVSVLGRPGTSVAVPKHPAASDSVQITTYQCKLQPRLAQALSDLFNVALAQTRYPNDHLQYVDGIEYTFITHSPTSGYRSGNAHSPAPGSHMGQLVTITVALRELATNSENHEFAQAVLLTGVEDLLFDLAQR